jgi:hypothetical protein
MLRVTIFMQSVTAAEEVPNLYVFTAPVFREGLGDHSTLPYSLSSY